MGKPAARVGDMHTCPMWNGNTPHVGGPVMPPGKPTVMIGGMPAATMGNMCTCTGPPDSIVLGSMGVMIGGQPAARMGDMTAHGGTITAGCPTVLIGEVGAGGRGVSVIPVHLLKPILESMPSESATKLAQIVSMTKAAKSGKPLVHDSASCSKCSNNGH